MKIGAFLSDVRSGAAYKGLTLEQGIQKVTDNGIVTFDVPAYMFRSIKPAELAEMVKRYGGEISSVHYDVTVDWFDDVSVSEGVNELKEYISLAAEAGSPNFMVVMSAKDFKQKGTEQKFKEVFRAVLPELVAHAKSVGVTATIEDFSFREYPYASFEDIDWLLKNIPDLRFTYDSGNFPLAFYDEEEGARLFADKTIHVHLKDLVETENGFFKRYGKAFDKRIIGEGNLKNREALSHLKRAGYDGALIIELCPSDEKLFDDILASAENIKKMLAET